MTQTNFEAMSRLELRKYISAHRDDDEAFAAYMHRLKTDPTIKWHSGGCDEEGMQKFESLIRQRDRKRESQEP